MTESSGIFTFPSTGYWYVVFNMLSNGGNSTAQYQIGKIVTTTNDSSYVIAAYSAYAVDTLNYFASCTVDTIIDVTSTSNVKVKFQYQSQSGGSNTVILCADAQQLTGATFIRLGDT